jgi:cytosine/adenosine deaminase-related metal-dependent hydrolase
MPDPTTILDDAYVLTRGAEIIAVECGRLKSDATLVDHGPGLLMPGLINAHTHLELSALKGRLPLTGDFKAWVRQLIDQRDQLSADEQVDAVRTAIAHLKASGCTAIGEVSTRGLSAEPLTVSGLAGVWFKELLGNPPGNSPALTDVGNLRGALAGHAPHTTHPRLLARLKAICRRNQRPFCLHLAESAEETEFITTARGPWAQLLDQRGIDYRDWPLPAPSPVVYADSLGLLDQDTLVVHALETDARDRAILAARGVSVCLCPRSNQHLHRRLPVAAAMVDQGLHLCLGTDSLASNTSLSLFDELAFCARHLPSLDPPTLLTLVTTGAARALGLGAGYGRLLAGGPAAMIYVDVTADSPQALLAQLLNLKPSTMITPFKTAVGRPPGPS